MRLALAFLLSVASSLAALETVSVSMVPDVAYEHGTVPAKFRLSIGASTAVDLPVSVTIGGGTATLGADFTLSGAIVGTTVTIPAGQSSADVIVTPFDDAVVEMRETVILTINADPTYLRGSQFTATMLIADDDLRLTWVPIKTDIAENLHGGSPIEAAVRLQFNQLPLSPVTVQYQLLNESGSATLGSDYMMTLMVRNAVNRASGSILSDRSITLNPADETWTVGCKVAATVTKPSNIVSVYDASKLRAGDWVQFGSGTYIYSISSIAGNILTLSSPTEADITKDSVVRNNQDATITTNGSVQGITLDLTEKSVDVAITPIYDAEAEGAETVVMRLLSSPDYDVESPTDMQLNLADDDELVSIVAVKDAVESPATTGVVRLNLAAPAPRNLTIPLDIVTGTTAVAGLDYVAFDSEVLVPQGSMGVDIEVIPLVRAGVNGTRVLSVTLIDTADIVLTGASGSAGSVAVINIRDGTTVSSYGTVTIQSPSTSASDATPVVAADLRVHIDRTGATNPDVIVPLTVSGAAIPTVDYEALPASVVLPGLLAASTVPAGSNFLQVVLSTSTTEVSLPAGSTLRVGASTTVTVKTAVKVGTAPVYVELASALTATVSYGTSIGANDVSVTVTPIADADDEGDETVSVTLSQPGDANFTIGSPSTGSVTIADSITDGPVGPVITPKPPVGSGSSTGGGCGMGGGTALILAGLGLGFALRRRRN